MSAPRFRFGVVAATTRSGQEWLARARRVEALGDATLLVPDRLGPLLSPLPALAAAAAATTTLRLGSFVLASGWRNPVVLAQEVRALDLLSGGRWRGSDSTRARCSSSTSRSSATSAAWPRPSSRRPRPSATPA
jgi:Luciferase-like monooxygenase